MAAIFAWLLLFPAIGMFRRSILTRQPDLHIAATAINSVSVGLWIQTISWATVPNLPALTAVFLIGLNTAFQFNDSQVTYDFRWLGPFQLVHVLIFDVALLVVDATGGHGLIAAWQSDSHATVMWLILQGLGFLLALSILAVVGRFARERDKRLLEMGRAQSQLKVLQAEQAVVQRTCDLMLGGLQAGRFSHDAAGPLSVMGITLSELERACPADARSQLAPALVDLRVATDRLREMTAFMSKGLKGEHPAALRDVQQLIEESRGHLRHLLKGHGRDLPELWIDVEPAQVVVEPLHATAIANILANGALQSRDAPLVVLGKRSGDHHYELRLRDHGVPPSQRAEAMDRIRQAISLSFRPTDARRDEPYEGQGLGLFLVLIVLTRQGGSIEVCEPEEGDGIEMVLTLRAAQGSTEATGEPDPA